MSSGRSEPSVANARRKVRVVHLVSALNVGGLEKVVIDLARLMDRTIFVPRVLCLREVGELAPSLVSYGVPVESLACRDLGKFRTLFRLVRRLSQLRPAVLHTHNPDPHFLGTVAARILGVPVVLHTKHGRNYPDRFRAVTLNRLASHLSQRVVTVSEDAARVARDVEHVPGRKVTVIHNGIDIETYPPLARPGTSTGQRAIHVARLTPAKDQETLLRAARLVADVEPKFRLDIVGDGPAREKVQSLAQELVLGRHVSFLGYREDVRSLLSEADLFVLSSLKEGISLTLLEAMACSLPIVSTDVGGNPEVVVDGQTGLLVPSRSPEKLAGAMLTLLRNPSRARHMGLAGRRRVEEEFDLRGVVSHYEQLYLSSLVGGGLNSSRISPWGRN